MTLFLLFVVRAIAFSFFDFTLVSILATPSPIAARQPRFSHSVLPLPEAWCSSITVPASFILRQHALGRPRPLRLWSSPLNDQVFFPEMGDWSEIPWLFVGDEDLRSYLTCPPFFASFFSSIKRFKMDSSITLLRDKTLLEVFVEKFMVSRPFFFSSSVLFLPLLSLSYWTSLALPFRCSSILFPIFLSPCIYGLSTGLDHGKSFFAFCPLALAFRSAFFPLDTRFGWRLAVSF